MATATIPVLFLRGISMEDITRRYNEGEFFKLEKLPKSKVTIGNEINVLATKLPNDNGEPIFSMRDLKGREITYASSNSSAYMYYMDKQELPKGGVCQNCMQIFSHERVIFPQDYVIIKGQEKTKYFFWGDEIFHSFRCCYTKHEPYLGMSVEEKKRVELLLFMYSLVYPGKPMVRCNDYRLLISNGGSLTPEQWEDENTSYIKTPNVILAPCKFIYQKQIFTS